MRATTRCTPKVSRATRAEMMLELSPEETAAKPSARSMPAAVSTCRSNPSPVTVRPLKSCPSRRKASPLRSTTATECPRASRLRARVEPTRPQPMMTMCTLPPGLSGVRRRYESATARPSALPDATRLPHAGADRPPPRAACATHLVLSVVASPTSFLKRLLVGRPFRSDRLQHTLLPKRIALPVFASDALSSVAYAPDEILLTLSIAGASAYVFSPWIALAVVVVMLTVVASYRQNVRSFSSGCAALTGVEAISNGVPAFKPPKSKNAATTLLMLGLVAISMLIGIIALSRLTHLQFVECDKI